MITNKGLNNMAVAYSSVPGYLVVGSGGGVVSNTSVVLSGEFDRIALDSLDVMDNTVRFYGSRSGVVANDDLVTNLGLTVSGVLGTSDLEAGNLLGSLIHSSDFDIGVEFWFTFNRS